MEAFESSYRLMPVSRKQECTLLFFYNDSWFAKIYSIDINWFEWFVSAILFENPGTPSKEPSLINHHWVPSSPYELQSLRIMIYQLFQVRSSVGFDSALGVGLSTSIFLAVQCYGNWIPGSSSLADRLKTILFALWWNKSECPKTKTRTITMAIKENDNNTINQ